MKAKIFVGGDATGKTRVAKLIAEYVGINNTLFVDGKELFNQHNINKVFQKISESTKLIIVDDCHPNLNFEQLFHVIDNLKFSISIIFTTNHLFINDPKYGHSFFERFEIVEFPLSLIK